MSLVVVCLVLELTGLLSFDIRLYGPRVSGYGRWVEVD